MAGGLAERHCEPCSGGTPPLAPDQLRPLLDQLKGWDIQDNRKLAKVFRFPNFVAAVEFVNAITPLAEAEGHHPDLSVSWGKVGVKLWTHSIGALSDNDFIMAAKIDALTGQG